jgi:16S rRNA (cytosine1402-N4)-methyltransferase
MSLDTSPHYPVMLNEVIKSIKPNNKNTIVDCTFGCGGYSKKILEIFPNYQIIAIDRDPSVKKFAEALNASFKNRFKFINDKFSNLENIIRNYQDDISYFIFDFGISSFQLDNYDRGFSFNSEIKLDMRMGHNTISAYEIVNEAPLEDLNSIIKIFGEDNDHKKIAKEIVQIRKNKTIHTTKELRNTILKAKGNRYFKKDPCTKTFQALRMIVNQELSEIFNALKKTIELSKTNTGITTVTFHSLEDRIVKKIFNISKDLEKNPSRYLPKITPNTEQSYIQKMSNKAIKPTEHEIAKNPRSRSAKLRSIIKMGNDKLNINRKDLKMERLFELEEKYAG